MKEIFSKIHRFTEQDFMDGQQFTILLPSKQKEHVHSITLETLDSFQFENLDVRKMLVGKSYKVEVKRYMTEPASDNFDFQDKWNNGIPMPLCIMTGKVLKETRGMFQMELTAKMEAGAHHCLCCGRPLTNPVSKLYGIGPECSEKVGLIRIESSEEAKEKLEILSNQISNIKWTGWVIKSAIKDWEEV